MGVDKSYYVEDTYRHHYLNGALNALADYPFFGVGLDRLSLSSHWEKDAFYFHYLYNLPTQIPGTYNTAELSTSDSGLTLIGEMGGVGIVMICVLYFNFIYLSIKLNCKKYLYVVIQHFVYMYSAPSWLFNVFFSFPFWFLYGILIFKKYNNLAFLHKKSKLSKNYWLANQH